MKAIIAIGHQKRVGKDTAARMVQTIVRQSNKFKLVKKSGFADKVKDQCYDLYKWAGLQPGDFYEEPENGHLKEVKLPLINKSPRDLWIGHGMAVRSYMPDAWTDYWLNTLVDFNINKDLRFPNEAEKIKERGGKVILLLRPSVPHTSDAADDPLLGYKGWTDTIINDTDLGGLYKKIAELLRYHYGI